MTPSDYVGTAILLGFGFWWILFPESVIRFYTWFHKRKSRLPGARWVRIMGVVWVLAVAVVQFFALRKK